jgi:hypothetical protein
MPGSFGATDNDNGAFATTKATDKFGVFGFNEATSPPTGGGAGGAGVFGLSVSPGAAGVFGSNNSAKGVGVQGNGPEVGVSGFSAQAVGVRGVTQSSGNFGVFGSNDSSAAPTGGGAGGSGVFGLSVSPGGAGVFGSNNSAKGVGVQGNGPDAGVSGFSDGGAGVMAQSRTGTGLVARGGHLAAVFDGDVEVTGDIKLTHGDCAEEFSVIDATVAEPGTVMIVDETGLLRPSLRDYDTRVAGIVSGAGSYQPALTLDHRSASVEPRCAIAMMGKVYCKVDADQGAIMVGDLLTTSPTIGHAMRAADKVRAFGAVIGKALQPIARGRGMITVLVSLQ